MGYNMYQEATTKVLSLISKYREEMGDSSHELLLTITDYCFGVMDIDTGFGIVVWKLGLSGITITEDTAFTPKSLDIGKYNYLDILSRILSLDNITKKFSPRNLEEGVYRQLHVHQRESVIQEILDR